MAAVVDQSEGQAGPMRWRCRVDDGAASHASTRGVDRRRDQLREKDQSGEATVR